jgi:predicted ATPase/DNA-binding CsgD family transcriptional regulator
MRNDGASPTAADNRRHPAVTIPNNLPAELSSFVGREPQLAELRRLLRKSRMITLTGPGGAGKSRLAQRLAAVLLNRHPDGVWLVELGPVDDARLLEQIVATACAVREERGRSIVEVLVDKLGGRRTLLILDGCEHLVDACAALAGRLLRSCPRLTLLVTSREPLGLPGELVWRTPSLTVPGPNDAARPEVLLQSEAVRLFVERARLSRPDFDFDPTVSGAVASICTRLEGMPLAIELAAGLERVMTPQEILERLSDRFRLLTGGSRTALPRHQTLRQTVDWSYNLLSEPEKALLDRLAVFAGGFDLAAAESIAGSGSADTGAVLPLLSRLVDKSLVVAEPGRPDLTRYHLLDTIREYALEKLQPGDSTDARRRHAQYFLEWTRQAGQELRSHEQGSWMRRLDEEQANIRLALGWSLSEQPGNALELAASMSRYWHMRRHLDEGLGWLNQALELRTPTMQATTVALLSRARIHWRHGDYANARLDAEACLDLSHRLGQEVEVSGSLNLLGVLSSGDGEWDVAERFFADALEVARRLDDQQLVAGYLNNIALIASARGEHEAAKVRLEEAAIALRAIGDRFGTATVLDSLARVNFLLGAHAIARRVYVEAIAIAAEFMDPMNTASCLEGLAMLALAEGDAARMVRLVAAAKSLRAGSGGIPEPVWERQVEEGLVAAKLKLGRTATDLAWRQGAALTMDEAVRDATGTPPGPARDGASPLTARERQVAALIAEGMTNVEIATRLKMAGRTADAHVEHIRNKLGLRTRSQIAIWAHERLGTA